MNEFNIEELMKAAQERRIELTEIPEWIHTECYRRARLHWDMMLRFTGYDPITNEYMKRAIPEKVNESTLATMRAIKSLYDDPLIDPDGNEVEKTEQIWAWWDEYAVQCSFFPSETEYEEAKKEVADYYKDGKRFVMQRWYDMKQDVLDATEDRRANALN